MKKNNITFLIRLKSLIFWICFISLLFLFTFVILILFLLPISLKAKNKIVAKNFARIFLQITKIVNGITYKVIGSENVLKEACLIASNHQSLWETIAFNHLLPSHVWVLKKELMKLPIVGWGLSLLKAIAIDRSDKKSSMNKVAEQTMDRLDQQLCLLMFPEGTRMPVSIINAPYKLGIARMAVMLNKPILPVVHNAGYIMPKSNFLLFNGCVTIKILPPIYPKLNETPEELTERLRKLMQTEYQNIQNSNNKS